jgi:hypothetical protein
VLPDQLVHGRVNRDVVLVKLFFELIHVNVPLSVVLYNLRHLLLIRVYRRACRPSLRVLTSVELQVIGVHRWVVGRVLLLVFLIVQSLRRRDEC